MVEKRNIGVGAANSWLILSICLIFVTLIAMATAGWGLYHFYEQKNTVDGRIANAKSEGIYDGKIAAAADYKKALDSDFTTFSGPADYGTLTFSYPKFWSVYIAKNGSEGLDYQAFLNPGTVDGSATQYALEVWIQEKDYATVVNSYTNLVKQNKLTSSATKVNGEDATQLKGNFTQDIRGTAVIFKIRDKTVTVRTDADSFLDQYNHILSTIKFNS